MNNAMSTTITKLAPALLAAQKEMGNATKGASNPYFKSSYADLNSVREAVLPAFNKYGIAVLQPTCEINGKNYVNTVLIHESGEYISSLTEIKNTKGDAQSEGSGISYARRYGLQSFANVGAVDDDGEATMARDTKKTTKPTVADVKVLEHVVKELKKSDEKTQITPPTNGKSSFRKETVAVADDWE